MKSRWISMILVLCMMLQGSAFAAGTGENTQGNLSFFVDPQTLGVTVLDQTNGYIWSSPKDITDADEINDLWKNQMIAGITISYYDTKTKKTRKASSVAEDCKVNCNQNEASLRFQKAGIEMRVEYQLSDGCLMVRIPQDSIKESEKSKLVSVMVMPFFGAVRAQQSNGYIVVPDGCGALMDFSNPPDRVDAAYSAEVYGADKSVSVFTQEEIQTRQKEQLSMPVYGMVHSDTKNAYLARAYQGAESAKLTVSPAGVVTPYHWAAYEFFVRQTFFHQTGKDGSGFSDIEAEMNRFDIEMRYYFLNGENADYSGLAGKYREVLKEEGVLQEKDDTAKPLRMEFLGGEKKKSMLGFRNLTLTTISQVREMIADSGTDPLVVLRGFENKNHDGILRKLGKTDDMQALTQNGENTVYLSADLVYTDDNDKKNNVKTVDERMLSYEREFKNYTLTKFVQGTQKIKERYETQKELAERLGVKTAAEYAGTLLASDYQRKHRRSRIQAREDLIQVFGDDHLAFYMPNAYLWKNTEAYLDMPVSSSGSRYFTKEIPFLQMVVSGCMDGYGPYFNFAEDSRTYLLKHIEYGVHPSFILTQESPHELSQTQSDWIYSSEYALWKDILKETEQEIQSVLSQVEGSVMVSHENTSDTAAAVRYANGKTVLVNYSEQDQEIEGHMVKGLGYEVIG